MAESVVNIIPEHGSPEYRGLVERCRSRYWNAVQYGKLVRGACEEPQAPAAEVCGAIRVDGHHEEPRAPAAEDYRFPLAVRWLCRAHHARRHMELGWR